MSDLTPVTSPRHCRPSPGMRHMVNVGLLSIVHRWLCLHLGLVWHIIASVRHSVCQLNGVIGVSCLCFMAGKRASLIIYRLVWEVSIQLLYVCRASGSYMYILHIPNQWIGIERGAGRRPYSNAPRDPIHGVTSPLPIQSNVMWRAQDNPLSPHLK